MLVSQENLESRDISALPQSVGFANEVKQPYDNLAQNDNVDCHEPKISRNDEDGNGLDSRNDGECDLILDFFAGSATTALAVMKLNSQDNANRRFILVQLDEKIDEKKSKTAFDFCKNELKSENPTIFDITKERIIRAEAKIASLNSSQDVGFKIYELTPSIKAQDANLYNFLNQEHKNALLETFRLDLGIALHIPNETVNLEDYEAIRVNERLFLLDTGFKTKHLKCLIEKIDKENFIIKEVIYLNNAFESARIRELEEGLRSYSNKKGIKISLNARFL